MSDERLPRAMTRPEPRETGDVLRSLGIEPKALAKEVRKETPPWKAFSEQIPVLVLVLGGFATFAVKWDRTASKDDVAAKIEATAAAAEQRSRALELEITSLGRQVLELRLAAAANATETERRLGELEKARRHR